MTSSARLRCAYIDRALARALSGSPVGISARRIIGKKPIHLQDRGRKIIAGTSGPTSENEGPSYLIARFVRPAGTKIDERQYLVSPRAGGEVGRLSDGLLLGRS